MEAEFPRFFGTRIDRSCEPPGFDSAIPRFESWRPSQPKQRARCSIRVTYLAGNDRTKVRAASISFRRNASLPKAIGPARTQPCICRPRDIIGMTSGIFSAQPSLFLPSLASIPSSRAPHRRLPLSSQAHPPNSMCSSRDWAAKGVALLGIRAVLASSFERIHRSNLINMGILPLRLSRGDGPQDLTLKVGDCGRRNIA